MVKIVQTFVFFLTVLFFGDCATVGHKTTKFSCTASNKTAENYTCFAKSYSRNFSTFNVDFFTKRPLNDIMVKADISRKQLSPNYIKFLETTVDLCKYLSGTKNFNPTIQWFVDIVGETIPKDLYHPCPFSGELKGYNLTLNGFSKVLNHFVGTYRTILRFYDPKDDNILTMNLVTEVKITNNVHKDMTNPILIN